MAGDAPGTAHDRPARPRAPAPAAPLALYRKYRPASFAEVKGQEHVTEPLRQALLNGRIHHAYLFSGPRGCGKTSSARILARSLNCEQGPTPDPCGVCASCVALAPQGPGSIDVIEIDAASHGGVDDARDLRERAFYAPVSGRFKIYIIDEAHMVTREGFNALLKLVEEPPPHLKFVFATTEPEKVIATIRSRTHHYPFRLVPPAVLRELLEQILAAEQVSYQPAVLPLVVRAGAGSVRDTLSILDQLLAGSGPEGLVYDRTVALLGYSDDSLLDEMADAFAAGDGAAVFQTVDKVVEGGHDPRRFAADLLDRLRDLIILAAVPGAGQSGLLDAPADRLERMAEQAGRFGQAELTRAAEIISEGLIQMRGTTSPRLLLELTCAQVLLPAASTGEKALLARLERLEHQLAGLGPGGAIPADGPRRRGPAAEERAPGRPARDEAAHEEPDQGSSARVGSIRAAGARAASAPPDPTQVGPAQASPAETGPGQESARQASSTRAEPGVGQPDRAEPGHAGPGHAGPGRTGLVRAEPAPAEPGRPDLGQRPGPGRADTETFRQRWPEILEAVRSERKVAWILLRNTSAESFEGSVLTVAFGSEGEARSFASSGHDAVLIGAIAAMLGVNVRVRPVAVGASASGLARPPAAGPPAASRPGTGPARPGASSPDSGLRAAPETAAVRAAGAAPVPASPPGPAAAVTPAAEATPATAVTPAAEATPATAVTPAAEATPAAAVMLAPASPEPGGGNPAGSANARAADPPAGPAGAAHQPAGPAGAGGRPARRRPPKTAPAPSKAAVPADEPWPDDASGPDADLTGMELIARQLGGQVIEEIDEG